MNWALINGEKEFTITIIKVDKGVDTGDILLERTFQIKENYNISDLHRIANQNFPEMILQVVENLDKNNLISKKQKNDDSSYYPLRFPDDGTIFFDYYTAEQIHNRVRALSVPYPGVLTYYKNKKIKILKTKLTSRPFYGEPGRVYRISKEMGVLVCAQDRCIWLKEVISEKTGENCINDFERYTMIATIKNAAINNYEN